MSKRCPRVRLETLWRSPLNRPDEIVLSILATVRRRNVAGKPLQVGRLHVQVHRDGAHAESFDVWVDEGLRRCGLATRMYQLASQQMCARGALLTSHDARTEENEEFWRKQRTKGRAECIGRGGDRLEPINSPFDLQKVGRWPCKRYRLLPHVCKSSRIRLNGK